MPDKIILCVDLQERFLGLISGGWPKEGLNARPWEGDRRAWDAPNAFIQRAAEAGIPTWYVAYTPDPKFKDVSSVVGDADWEMVSGRFGKSDCGGFSHLHMTKGSPVFFKGGESIFIHPHFLAELEKQGVKAIAIIGCDGPVCVANNALSGIVHGKKVEIVQNHVFGGEMGRVPKTYDDKDRMRSEINDFRASDERTQQIVQHLVDKCKKLNLPPDAVEQTKIVTEEAFFSPPAAHVADRPNQRSPDNPSDLIA